MFCSPLQREPDCFGKAAGTGGAQSRSTSAGSAPSEGLSSVDRQNLPERRLCTQEYHNNTSGLPEYDYPTPWSIKTDPKIPEVHYPLPLVMKNTFLDFDVWRAPSLKEFYKERQTQSCPTSAISLPPGLEDQVGPNHAAARFVAAAKLVVAEATLRCEVGMPEPRESKAAAQQMEHLLPSGLLDDMPFHEAQAFLPLPPQQAPASDSHWRSALQQAGAASIAALQQAPPPAVSSALQQAPPALGINWQSHMSAPPPHAPVFDMHWSPPASPPVQATKQAVILDLMQALASPSPVVQGEQAVQQVPFFANHFDTQCFSLPPVLTADLTTPEPVLGSHECPTVGSQSHWLGTCRPCAFLHTKGCDNGVLCAFCHICDKGAKKRRAKDSRAIQRGFN